MAMRTTSIPASENPSRRIAFFISTLRCGGAERAVLNLVRAAAELGIPLDLLLGRAEGPFLSEVPSEVRIIDFKARKLQHTIPKLARYLRQERPHGVVSQITQANVALLIARKLARSQTRAVVVEVSSLSANTAAGVLRPRVRMMARWTYPAAGHVVGVSCGVARDVERCLGLKQNRVRVIYNPVVDSHLLAGADQPSPHPWLNERDRPVLLTVGRLGPEKDQATLLRAFAILRKTRPARLIIYGEGTERARLESLRRELDLVADVDLPGMTSNPYAAMRSASLFVLSSRFEGLGNVLIEALACGCPVAATDCPSGPSEILAAGQFGMLAPPGNPRALANAMLAGLDQRWDRQVLRARGAEFSVGKSLNQYLEALDYPLPTTALAGAA
jgi:glycosyltransferase involved in cell wall biosynthesis